MKLYSLLLASILLATSLISIFFAEPCAAAFIPGNSITLERNGMIWNYDEKITDNDAIFYRNLIDEAGNSNGFVNAWEILKTEVLLSGKMKKAIEDEPDVRLNSTSDTVELKDVEFFIPREALGKTEKNSSITNHATVTYSFKEEAGTGTTIWLMGTPNSSVTITLPQGFDAELTEGLENKSIGFDDNRTQLRGNFSSEKNITIRLSENESLKAELRDMKAESDKVEEDRNESEKNETLNAGVNARSGKQMDFLKGSLKKLTGA